MIRRVQQRDRDFVSGIVTDPSHQMMQTKIRIDHARRGGAVGHVVAALTWRIRTRSVRSRGRQGCDGRIMLARLALAPFLIAHGRTLVLKQLWHYDEQRALASLGAYFLCPHTLGGRRGSR